MVTWELTHVVKLYPPPVPEYIWIITQWLHVTTPFIDKIVL